MMILKPVVTEHTAIKYTGENYDSVLRFVSKAQGFSVTRINNLHNVNSYSGDLWLFSHYGTQSWPVSINNYIVNDGYTLVVLSKRQLQQRYGLGNDNGA